MLDRGMRAGAWFTASAVAGTPRLSEMTLGVVGLGNIGARVAQLALGLGMKAIGFDPKVKSATIPNAASLDALLPAVDAVTLHVPLTDATRGMMGTGQFGLMRKGAFVLNTGRGPLIEQDALIAALKSGQIGGAGLDVFEQEPLDRDSPLRSRADVVLTPHSAYYSESSIIEARRRPMEGIRAVLAGRRPANQVNG
jgi:phosphoglycerate dehydrogenase-like enzyme